MKSAVVTLMACAKPKPRVKVLVSVQTGRMAVKEKDGWRVFFGDDGN